MTRSSGAPSRVLAIDPGSVRVGLAVSDEDARFSSPHKTLPASRNLAALVEALSQEIEQLGVGTVVIGLALHMSGAESPASSRARQLADALTQRAAVRVVLWDERLSTVAAQRVLKSSKRRASAQREVIDQVAASMILQSYLDSRHGTSEPDL